METQKVTYRCTAGLKRTFDMKPENVIEIRDDFVAFDSSNQDNNFLPECEECKTATVGIEFGDDNKGHLVKICRLTKVDDKYGKKN